MKRRFVAALMLALALLTPPRAWAEGVGLMALPVLDAPPGGDLEPLALTLEGVPLPLDADTGRWLVPCDETGMGYAPELPEGWRAYRGAADDPLGEAGLSVYATDGETWRRAEAALTRLPVLCLDMDDGGLPGDADAPGTLTMFALDGRGRLAVTRTPAELNLRGNTSRRFPKKSYRLHLVDGWGGNVKLSVAGLREDDDWILNPLYSDTSKVREALGLWLWETVNRCGRAAAGSRLSYAEVLLNGEYWGLYGVQERVDRKQVDADKARGILYKADANDLSDVDELLARGDAQICGGLELVYRGGDVDAPWLPAADYIALLRGEDAPGGSRLSLPNAVDYCLWAVLTQARDNHFKNQFIHCAPEGEGYALYRIPWDVNHILGDLWSGESPQTNYVAYDITRLALDDAARALLPGDDGALRAALIERWRELRSGEMTEERLSQRAHGLFDALYPAILRDTARWPECGMGEGSAANLRDIDDYFGAILPAIDGWIDALEREGRG